MPARPLLAFLPAAALAVALSGCGGSSDPVAAPAPAPTNTAGVTAPTTVQSRQSSGNEDPGTTVGTAAPLTGDGPDGPSPSSTFPVPTLSTPSGPGKSTTTTTVPGAVQIPAGTSAADKQWCAQAKPVSAALTNLFGLTAAQLATLVDQANALVPTAPTALQPFLTTLHDTGGKFLAAVQAGKATISENGIIAWANSNLTQTQQTDFLAADSTVTSYINRTC
jgi:hypothetical protein